MGPSWAAAALSAVALTARQSAAVRVSVVVHFVRAAKHAAAAERNLLVAADAAVAAVAEVAGHVDPAAGVVAVSLVIAA